MTEQTRAAKIAELKKRIAAGEYQPDLEEVAESLLKYILGQGHR